MKKYVICPAFHTNPFVCAAGRANDTRDLSERCGCGEREDGIHVHGSQCDAPLDANASPWFTGCVCRPATAVELAAARLRGLI